MTLRKYRK